MDGEFSFLNAKKIQSGESENRNNTWSTPSQHPQATKIKSAPHFLLEIINSNSIWNN